MGTLSEVFMIAGMAEMAMMTTFSSGQIHGAEDYRKTYP